MPCTKKMIIWNDQDIKIDKTIFFHTWFYKGVLHIKRPSRPESRFPQL